MQTIGREGLGWTPFLLSIFIFVYLCNVPGIIPIIYMPATARMAIPLFLGRDRVADVQHRRLQAQRDSATSPGCCGRANVPVAHAAARRPHRVPLEHPPAPVQPGRPTLRQHARRAHAAGHVRPADERPVLRRDEAVAPQADVRPAVLHAAVPHRLRGPRRLPAGVHLHDPHRRLHRSRRCTPSTDRPAASSPHHQHTGAPPHMEALAVLDRPEPPAHGSTDRRRPTPPSAPASPTASPPSAPASASATSSARPSRRWPASPRPPAWSARRCSSASPSPRRSP